MIRSPRRTFEFAAFVDVFNELQPLLGDPATVDLDLSKHHFYGPSGMAPLIALIDHYTEAGWIFNVYRPNPEHLDSYWVDAGWFAGVAGETPPPVRVGSTFTPLTYYSSHAELNQRLNVIMDVFARVSEFSPGVLSSVEFAMNEIADNVLVHSGGAPGWIQAIARPNVKRVEVVVADCGRGIHRTIRDAFPEITTDEAALRWAIERGVTRDVNVGQGNGLAGSIRIAQASHGWVNILAGTANLRLFDDGHFDDLKVKAFPGTVVTLTLPTDVEIDISEALWGREPASSFEYTHLDEEGILFRLLDEATGFGNRGSGAELATKLRNLMTVMPRERVAIDFEGIDVASASFLDEFLAKSIKAIGVSTFFSQFTFRNMNEFVRRTADAVIKQRLSN